MIKLANKKAKSINIVGGFSIRIADVANHVSLSVGLYAKSACGRRSARKILRIVGVRRLRIADVAKLDALFVGRPGTAPN